MNHGTDRPDLFPFVGSTTKTANLFCRVREGSPRWPASKRAFHCEPPRKPQYDGSHTITLQVTGQNHPIREIADWRSTFRAVADIIATYPPMTLPAGNNSPSS